MTLYFGQSSTVNIGHAEARVENTHSGKMAHISISVCRIVHSMGFSFISIEVRRDCIPALASSCKNS